MLLTHHLLTQDLKYLLIEYTITHPIKFKSFIDKNKINYHYLCANPAAIYLVEKYIHSGKIREYGGFLSSNPNAMHILLKNQSKIDWIQLSSNTNIDAINLIQEKLNIPSSNENNTMNSIYLKISWYNLSTNPSAIQFMEKYPNKLDMYYLGKNPNAMHLIEKIPSNEIGWYFLSINPSAIHILEKYPDKINLGGLCQNIAAIDLLNKNIEHISHSSGFGYNWNKLSQNPGAIDILDKHPEMIKWESLSVNPHPKAIKLIGENINLEDRINYNMLSLNESIFDINRIKLKKLLRNYKI